MTRALIALAVDDTGMSLDELAAGCAVTTEWVVERVEAGLLTRAGSGENWIFSSHELLRARRLRAIERDFEANPELAGLVADLMEELERLRVRLRRAGISME